MPLLPLPALALVLSAHIPSADPPALGTQRVAILRLRFAGKIPEGLQDLFAERLAQGLTAARLEVMPGPDVASRLASAPEDVAACQSPACYPALAALLKASYLITAEVSESNKTYTMVLDIINGQSGGVLASSHESCETCGAEEAGEKMGLAASALRERLEVEASAPAHVLIRSRPSGATVVVDGQPSGVTPLAAELTAGKHQLQLVLRDHAAVARSFTAVAGVEESVELTLPALPSRFPQRTAGWSALGGGAALLLAGIVTTSFDHDQVACSSGNYYLGRCPQVWDTKWWGAAMIGVGVAAATVGATMVYLAPAPAGGVAKLAAHF